MTIKTAPRPLVSCIMPTWNRRRFVPQAIKYFLRQDYAPKELIIIDDGTDPISDLLPMDARIRSVRLEHKVTVGAKRNLACEQARGEIIVHWDDDDWMADWRLSYQVSALLHDQIDICGLNRVAFFDPVAGAAWEYVFPGTIKPWVYGATLCYTRAFWRNNPFPSIDTGEDTRFVWNDPEAKIVALPDNSWLASLVHPGNTSSKRTDEKSWTKYPLAKIRARIGTDWEFYEGG
ncbi:glycosyltransferase family A protein [uncultured Desulfobulbus sp.]|uniref:glycosyltransferase family 2 protein n=1 Tax=uncultured Desulfobulbus sp. TaxID=239745 RepID=UPI0029C83245|nr:glycosyltransferase family A protein [uncultured Desulfobulbus sp.]